MFSATINIVTSYYVIYGIPQRRKTIATTGVIFNLIILAFFKYSPLFASTFLNTNDSIGHFLLTIPLPIGISFFTFEGISLVVDVYKEQYFRDSNHYSLANHAKRTIFFISFFPHLISGPILKAHEFLPQISEKKVGTINWNACVKNLILGYFLKMVVADNLKDFTFWMQYPYFQSFSSISLIFMLFGYSCQIFADFAGYSIIAIGMAKLFGYNFIENFNFPYISTSFSEFWRRWHISLSSFLKEYLYIPLGGNRKGKVRTYVNLLITMTLGGLWHGAAWSYAIWGLFHGTALAVERLYRDYIPTKSNPIVSLFSGIFVFSFVTLAWLLFKLPKIEHVIAFLQSVYNNYSFADNPPLVTYIVLYSLPVILYHLFYLVKERFSIKQIKYDFIIYSILLFLILTNSGSPGSFIYFQF
ncbi:MBOAT family O-acyltransferase [Cytophagaceae bacterium YF14B1]|uniref:MBOAT family O-acyltransferase n=1 Tax=Xanthocytophaga flava TaxID=3048013 RepID=A0AAE3QV22_9BACT|nr:MBOAT family O-acyltransferase [Xanthocytophaga flavus]MDJ1483805.1 MBOAT family O-acyltransferase [Xanthocytophaga flavus]